MKIGHTLLFSLLLIGACSPKNISTPKPEVSDFTLGEKWTWKWQRTVDGEIQTAGEDLKEVVAYQGGLGFYYGKDTVQVSSALAEKESDTPFRDWPLKVGKTWVHKNEWKNNEGTQFANVQEVEIVSYEATEVEGGTFMAYKIEYNGKLTNSRGYKGTMIDIWWYAPTLKSYIKHVNKDGHGIYTNELTSYYSPK